MSLAPLLAGLALFFAAHVFTTRRAARAAAIDRLGASGYKALHSLVSGAGLVLIVWGFGYYRAQGYITVWDPPRWMGHINLALMLPAMILLAAAYAPPGRISEKSKHPMLAAVKLWAFGHLLANGDLGSILLFGSFLAYGVYDRIAVKKRAAVEGVPPSPPPSTAGDVIALVVGVAAYAIIVLWLHGWAIGVVAMPGR